MKPLYTHNKLIIFIQFYLNIIFTKFLMILKKDVVLKTKQGIKIFNKDVLSFDDYIIKKLEHVDPREFYIGFDGLSNEHTLLDTKIIDSPHFDLMRRYLNNESIEDSPYIIKSSTGCLDERSHQYYSKKRLDNMEKIFNKRLKELESWIYIYELEDKKYVIDGKHRVALAALLDKTVNCYVVDLKYILDSFRSKMFDKMVNNDFKYSKNIEMYLKIKEGSIK